MGTTRTVPSAMPARRNCASRAWRFAPPRQTSAITAAGTKIAMPAAAAASISDRTARSRRTIAISAPESRMRGARSGLKAEDPPGLGVVLRRRRSDFLVALIEERLEVVASLVARDSVRQRTGDVLVQGVCVLLLHQ